MRKEPIIAGILGSLIGLIAAFGVWQFVQRSDSSAEPTQNEPITHSDISDAEGNTSLSLIEPSDFQVYSDSPIKISGFAERNTTIGVYLNEDYYFGKANQKGEFEFEVEIEGGLNSLKVWSFPDAQTTEVSTFFVYTTQVDESEDTDQITILTSAVGTVTDILEDSVQIKRLSGEIEQLSIDDLTTYVSIVKDTEDAEFEDLAIGDYIIAIGRKEDSVFTTNRVLISTENDLSNILGIRGQITSLNSTEFLVEVDGEEFSIDATGKVKVTKHEENEDFSDARLLDSSEGEDIIILGELEDELTAARIHIFPQ